MHFIKVPLYEGDPDIKVVRVNPEHIVYYKEHLDDGTMLRMSTDVNIYTRLTIMEVDALVDRAL